MHEFQVKEGKQSLDNNPSRKTKQARLKMEKDITRNLTNQQGM